MIVFEGRTSSDRCDASVLYKYNIFKKNLKYMYYNMTVSHVITNAIHGLRKLYEMPPGALHCS